MIPWFLNFCVKYDLWPYVNYDTYIHKVSCVKNNIDGIMVWRVVGQIRHRNTGYTRHQRALVRTRMFSETTAGTSDQAVPTDTIQMGPTRKAPAVRFFPNLSEHIHASRFNNNFGTFGSFFLYLNLFWLWVIHPPRECYKSDKKIFINNKQKKYERKLWGIRAYYFSA